MRLRAFSLLAVLLTVAVPSAAGGGRRAALRGFALVDYHIARGDFEGSRLVRADPLTGQRLGPTGPKLGDAVSGVVISPDRRFAAFGGLNFGEVVRVDLVHLRRLAPLKLVRGCCGADGGDRAEVLAWPTRRRLIVTSGPTSGTVSQPRTLRVVDPVRDRILNSVPLGIPLASVVGADGEVVILTGPVAGIGPVRLVLVTRSGTVRSVVLAAITSGTNGEVIQEHREAGLAVDFTGRRAFVLGAGQPVAEVSLLDLTVRYHALARPALDPGSALPGPAQPTGTQGPSRGSLRLGRWLGHGRIAVSGYDSAVHGLTQADTPLGLRLIDTRSWTVRVLDPAVSWFDVARGTLLAASVAWKPAARRFAGFTLEGLSPTGRVRFRLLPYRSTAPAPGGPWLVKEQRLYVQRSGREYELREPHGGTLRRRFRTTTDLDTLFTWRPSRSAD